MGRNFRGSVDTSRKLNALSQYLQAYSIALQDQGFARIYIDAFAGSGTRTETAPALPLFGRDSPEEVNTPGSASIALAVNPPFDTLAFFEADPVRFQRLEQLRTEHPDRKVVLRQGNANDFVRKLCERVPWYTKQSGIMG